MSRFIAQLVTGAISMLGLIHVYWAFGGRAASKAAIPEIDGHRAFSPSRLATLAVAVALFSAAALVAAAGRLIANPFPPSYIRMATILFGVLLIARAIGDFHFVGFFKRKSVSRFARLDAAVYSPLCLALGLGVLFVAFHHI
jgi:hypothetical protein